ncbi:hypothetical protein PCANC_22551 [Puccinia coronata f. sp. avenae]|uniref:Uncharacterized protein n=1 Tax=Puccinia coronata f. sp. avenae TaxID=200324 RepID=A0A2N5SBU1_9BASI|nr:hypothetical protein PCANC_22551 [Puccinia coronata f. sp. avenae]
MTGLISTFGLDWELDKCARFVRVASHTLDFPCPFFLILNQWRLGPTPSRHELPTLLIRLPLVVSCSSQRIVALGPSCSFLSSTPVNRFAILHSTPQRITLSSQHQPYPNPLHFGYLTLHSYQASN